MSKPLEVTLLLQRSSPSVEQPCSTVSHNRCIEVTGERSWVWMWQLTILSQYSDWSSTHLAKWLGFEARLGSRCPAHRQWSVKKRKAVDNEVGPSNKGHFVVWDKDMGVNCFYCLHHKWGPVEANKDPYLAPFEAYPILAPYGARISFPFWEVTWRHLFWVQVGLLLNRKTMHNIFNTYFQ